MERRPALSLLRVVPRLLIYGSSLLGYSWTLSCKGPPGPGTDLWMTPSQDPTLTATYGS
jgi:hypothetical protein